MAQPKIQIEQLDGVSGRGTNEPTQRDISSANSPSSTAVYLKIIDEKLTIDASLSDFFIVERNSNIYTLNIVNIPNPRYVTRITIKFISSSLCFVIWPKNILWSGGTAPPLCSTDLIVLQTDDGGKTFIGLPIGLDLR